MNNSRTRLTKVETKWIKGGAYPQFGISYTHDKPFIPLYVSSLLHPSPIFLPADFDATPTDEASFHAFLIGYMLVNANSASAVISEIDTMLFTKTLHYRNANDVLATIGVAQNDPIYLYILEIY